MKECIKQYTRSKFILQLRYVTTATKFKVVKYYFTECPHHFRKHLAKLSFWIQNLISKYFQVFHSLEVNILVISKLLINVKLSNAKKTVIFMLFSKYRNENILYFSKDAKRHYPSNQITCISDIKMNCQKSKQLVKHRNIILIGARIMLYLHFINRLW